MPFPGPEKPAHESGFPGLPSCGADLSKRTGPPGIEARPSLLPDCGDPIGGLPLVRHGVRAKSIRSGKQKAGASDAGLLSLSWRAQLRRSRFSAPGPHQ